MPGSSSSSLADHVADRAATVAWRSWRSLGAPAQAQPLRQTMIDPEGLIALTAVLPDPRILDVAAQWCRDNNAVISIPRLRGVAAAGQGVLASAIARFVGLVNEAEPDQRAPLRFASKPSLVAEPAVRIHVDQPAMLRLRARSLMGPTARAEALAILLARPEPGGITTSELSRLSLFGQRHLREALNELVYGEWVTRWRNGPREYRFEAAPSARRTFGPAPELVDWTSRVIVLDALLRASRELETPTVGSVARAMNIVDMTDVHLPRLSIPAPDWLEADTPEGLSRIRDWIHESVERLISAE